MKKENYAMVEGMVSKFNTAKNNGNKKEMKQIKRELLHMGIELEETVYGTRWNTINQVSHKTHKMSKLRIKLIQLLVGNKYGIMMNMTVQGKVLVDKPSYITNNRIKNA